MKKRKRIAMKKHAILDNDDQMMATAVDKIVAAVREAETAMGIIYCSDTREQIIQIAQKRLELPEAIYLKIKN